MPVSEVMESASHTDETTMGGGGGDVNNMEEDEKPRTLFVGNVPREVHKREIEEVFGEIGPLKRCYIQYPRLGNEKWSKREETTVAYVTFALSEDALKALETLQNSKIGSNKVNIKFVKTRGEQVRDHPSRNRWAQRPERSANFEPLPSKEAKEKEPRPKGIKKKARLIVRNLSWKVTDENIKEHFQQAGAIKDVNILKRPNGKLVGCAFIQYDNVYQAAKAIKELNLKPFLGRPIAIDWALPKDKYQTEDEKNRAKEVEAEEDEVVVKEEPESEMEEDEKFDAKVPYAHLGDALSDSEVKVEEDEKPVLKKRKHVEKEVDSDTEDDEEKGPKKHSDFPKRLKYAANDVEEGKTLFLRNLSFDVKEDELKQFFSKFGDLHYALLCKDSLTEHPKGTGFVKFKEKSSSDNCLQQFQEDMSEFVLSRRQFMVSVALPKDKVRVENKSEEKAQKPKPDSRNLYLAREGFIRPGSGAAANVSTSDMNKRASLNQVKKQMLKNLSIFISPTRLCVHSLPPTFSDKQLRKLFMKHAGEGAKLTEARVMRDMKDIDMNGKGVSKEFGFVNFVDHEHALAALRSINNNPSVFNANNRPIVEFSLENRAALKAKERRVQKSREKNPNKQTQVADDVDVEDNDAADDDDTTPIAIGKGGKRNKKHAKGPLANKADTETDAGNVPKYAGLVGKKGVQSVPSFKPKGKITRNSLKVKKPKKKNLQDRKQREPKIPSKRPIDRADKTDKIISKYQQKLNTTSKGENMKKKKWYDK